MRTSVFVGTSVDGFIARLDDTLDFLDAGGDEPHGFEEFFATVDALVMGRRTYDVVRSFGTWHYGEKPVFVLSSQELPAPLPGAVVERLSGAPKEIVDELASRGIEHAYVDGGATVQSFLRAGLIERLVITRVPVLIGSGIPLFGPLDGDVRLKHVETKELPSGLVQSEYAIVD